MHEKHSDIWDTMRHEFDCCMARFWNAQQGAGVTERTFTMGNISIIKLFTNGYYMTRIAEAEQKYEHVVEEVKAVMADTYLCRIMFDKAGQVVAYTTFVQKIIIGVAAVTQGGFAEESLDDYKDSLGCRICLKSLSGSSLMIIFACFVHPAEKVSSST